MVKTLLTMFIHMQAMQRRSLILMVIPVLVVGLIFSPLSTFVVFALPPDPKYESGKCATITQVPGTNKVQRNCCWTQIKEGATGTFKPRAKYCQTCRTDSDNKFTDCDAKVEQDLVLEQPPTPPPSGPVVLPEDGVLEQPPTSPPSGPAAPLQDGGVLEQPPGEGVAPPVTRDQGVLPQDGVLQQPPPADEGAAELPPPATEQTQPATVEEEQPVPVCQEGLEFNEDLGFCVPEDCPEGQVLDEESGICVLEEPEVVEAEPEQQSEPEEQDQQQSSEEGDDSGEDNTN
jgi:hypothetical protein